mmetsp:Transcript_2612/g.4016  ORF Transcript_2612/g.4016 Transcript_2612/m.4016 type:complete len:175 (+) Transcript_2612:1124-1648(+)
MNPGIVSTWGNGISWRVSGNRRRKCTTKRFPWGEGNHATYTERARLTTGAPIRKLPLKFEPLLEYIQVSNQDDMLRPKACFLLATAYVQQGDKKQGYEWYEKGVKADQERLRLFPPTDDFPDRMLIEGLSRRCSQCRAMLSNPKRCSKCHIAVYCNADCQRAHWKAGHKNECGG